MNQTIEQFIYKNHPTKSAETYMYYINIFLQRNPNARKYQFKDIVNYLGTEKQNNWSESSLNSMLIRIKRYYDYLVEVGVREDHPCKNLSTTTNYNRPIQLQDLFSSAELEEFLKREHGSPIYKQRNLVLISLLIYQGLTPDELINLQVSDISIDYDTIHIRPHHKTKGRTLDLKSKQGVFIERYLISSRPKLLKGTTSEKLLISARGDSLTAQSIWIVFNSLKLLFPDRKVNPVKIRLSVISNLLNEKKWAIEDVQQFAGHCWPSTTERLIKQDANNMRELINQFHPLK